MDIASHPTSTNFDIKVAPIIKNVYLDTYNKNQEINLNILSKEFVSNNTKAIDISINTVRKIILNAQ